MKHKQKRASGGGRKPKNPSGPGVPFSVRLPEDVLNQLRASAKNRGSKGKVSEELVGLLRLALSEKAARGRSRHLQGLFFLIEMLDRDIRKFATTSDVGWQSSPYCFGVLRGGVMRFLDELRPEGEITASDFAADPDADWGDDPEDLGRFFADYILGDARLAEQVDAEGRKPRSLTRDWDPEIWGPGTREEIFRQHYGSIKAIRDLKLTKGGKP
jgi:hypothetical protein